MKHNKKSLPIIQRFDWKLVLVKDWGGCYILRTAIPQVHIELYHGERTLYQTFGIDTSCGGGWRGNLSDDFPCYDFHYDLKKALKWLHESEDSIDDTLYLWTHLEKPNESKI
jgi:hypothetical protein